MFINKLNQLYRPERKLFYTDATEEEIEQAKTPSNPLKFKALFSTWAFWLVVVIGIAMFVLMAVAGMMMK